MLLAFLLAIGMLWILLYVIDINRSAVIINHSGI